MSHRRTCGLLLVSSSLAVLALACHDITAPLPKRGVPSASFTLTPSQANKLELEHLCGTRFSIENPFGESVTVTWKVFRSSDSGVVTLLPRPAGKEHSTTYFATHVTGKVRLYYQGRKVDQEETERDEPCAPRLHVSLFRGVTGPLLADTTVKAGTRLRWSFRAAAGYGRVTVMLDSSYVADTGSVLMTRDHVLMAGADSAVVLDAAQQQVAAALRRILASADPATDFQDYLYALDDYARAHPGESVADQLETTAFAAIDPVTDSAALARVDRALAGRLFRSSRPATAGASRTAKWTLGGPDAIRPVNPPPLLPPDPPDSATFIVVNGIRNSFPNALAFQQSLTAALANSGSFLAQRPRFDVRLAYNPSGVEQTVSGLQRCLTSLMPRVEFLTVLRWPLELSRCTGQAVVNFVVNNDLLESLAQVLVLDMNLPIYDGDADTVIKHVDAVRSEGRHAVLVPHSQGNLMVQQALLKMRDRGTLVLPTSKACVGAVSLSPPTAASWALGGNLLAPLQVDGDIILLLPSPHFPDRLVTGYAQEARDDLQRILDSLPPWETPGPDFLFRKMRWALRLHDVHRSYLSYHGAGRAVVSGAENVVASCMSKLQVTSGVATLFVGDTTRVSAAVVDGLGRTSAANGLVFESGDATKATVSAAGLVTAIDSGTVTIFVVDDHGYTGGTIVRALVENLSVAAELRSTVSEFVLWTTEGAPPPSTLAATRAGPVWDATSATCVARDTIPYGTDSTDAGVAIYAQRCSRKYSVSVPVPQSTAVATIELRVFEENVPFVPSQTVTVQPGVSTVVQGPGDANTLAQLLDRIEVTARNAAGAVLASGYVCLRGCAGWP